MQYCNILMWRVTVLTIQEWFRWCTALQLLLTVILHNYYCHYDAAMLFLAQCNKSTDRV